MNTNPCLKDALLTVFCPDLTLNGICGTLHHSGYFFSQQVLSQYRVMIMCTFSLGNEEGNKSVEEEQENSFLLRLFSVTENLSLV